MKNFILINVIYINSGICIINVLNFIKVMNIIKVLNSKFMDFTKVMNFHRADEFYQGKDSYWSKFLLKTSKTITLTSKISVLKWYISSNILI